MGAGGKEEVVAVRKRKLWWGGEVGTRSEPQSQHQAVLPESSALWHTVSIIPAQPRTQLESFILHSSFFILHDPQLPVWRLRQGHDVTSSAKRK
jgi:hypothetical protein